MEQLFAVVHHVCNLQHQLSHQNHADFDDMHKRFSMFTCFGH